MIDRREFVKRIGLLSAAVGSPAAAATAAPVRWELQPGDIIVVRYPARLSNFEIENFRAVLGEDFPGHKVYILDCGADLQVIRPAKP